MGFKIDIMNYHEYCWGYLPRIATWEYSNTTSLFVNYVLSKKGFEVHHSE